VKGVKVEVKGGYLLVLSPMEWFMVVLGMPNIYIGTSGYNYGHWAGGVFYPDRLPKRRWLEYYCQFFSSVELNVTFYRLPKEETFRGWYERTPLGFRFALKGSRFITHVKKLKDPDQPLRLFFNRMALLKEKAEVILWQLPPGFRINIGRLRGFISALSRLPNIRHAFEFREESWIYKEVFTLLSDNNMAVCMADWPPFNNSLPITADFIYVRRHGEGGSYATSYSKKELEDDARRIRDWLKKGKDVYIYFNNDAYGYAVKNAMMLEELIK